MKDLSSAVSTLVPVDRYSAMLQWLSEGERVDEVTPLAGDASFRRYFRVRVKDQSYVLMDAPTECQSSEPFVKVGQALAAQGVRTPRIYRSDLTQGFLLLEDFGDDVYLNHLGASNATQLYQRALDSLLRLQQCQQIPGYVLPVFDRARYQQELSWFEQWYLNEYLGVQLTQMQSQQLSDSFDFIIEQALGQPQVLVHKDYHSRNLMLLPEEQVGVIDFQDALIGPITYDLMSLFYDHYIAWPYDDIRRWLQPYQQQLLQLGLLENDDFNRFVYWHDGLALQRVMKNLGNFARLNFKHKKSRYLQDIPRIYRYILAITARYDPFSSLHALLQQWQPEESV